mmetsp:Transcript_74336/g.131826  ORF Transcript_74336/g.131826 Transcript_74336/m.131826 type:complete len:138 (+) Transcript_74336:81-494(+)
MQGQWRRIRAELRPQRVTKMWALAAGVTPTLVPGTPLAAAADTVGNALGDNARARAGAAGVLCVLPLPVGIAGGRASSHPGVALPICTCKEAPKEYSFGLACWGVRSSPDVRGIHLRCGVVEGAIMLVPVCTCKGMD